MQWMGYRTVTPARWVYDSTCVFADYRAARWWLEGYRASLRLSQQTDPTLEIEEDAAHRLAITFVRRDTIIAEVMDIRAAG